MLGLGHTKKTSYIHLKYHNISLKEKPTLKKNNDLFIRPLKKSNTWKDQDALMEKALTKIDYSLREKSIIQRKAWQVPTLCALGAIFFSFIF